MNGIAMMKFVEVIIFQPGFEEKFESSMKNDYQMIDGKETRYNKLRCNEIPIQ